MDELVCGGLSEGGLWGVVGTYRAVMFLFRLTDC